MRETSRKACGGRAAGDSAAPYSLAFRMAEPAAPCPCPEPGARRQIKSFHVVMAIKLGLTRKRPTPPQRHNKRSLNLCHVARLQTWLAEQHARKIPRRSLGDKLPLATMKRDHSADRYRAEASAPFMRAAPVSLASGEPFSRSLLRRGQLIRIGIVSLDKPAEQRARRAALGERPEPANDMGDMIPRRPDLQYVIDDIN